VSPDALLPIDGDPYDVHRLSKGLKRRYGYLVAIAVGTVVSVPLVIGIKQFTGGADTEKATAQAA
jgi:hypothetical protein